MRVVPTKEFYSPMFNDKDHEIVIRNVGCTWVLMRRAGSETYCRAEYRSEMPRKFKSVDSACRELKNHGIPTARIVF